MPYVNKFLCDACLKEINENNKEWNSCDEKLNSPGYYNIQILIKLSSNPEGFKYIKRSYCHDCGSKIHIFLEVLHRHNGDINSKTLASNGLDRAPYFGWENYIV